MGAWGYGNIENDTAQDMLAEICDGYFGRISDTLRSKQGHEYDEHAHDELFVLSEMLFAMNERGMVNSSPEPDELRPLFAPFMERWAEYHRSAGQDPPEERRVVMEDTFQRLLQVCESACQGSFAHRIGLITEAMSKPKADES
jgi:hypothetical protein